MSHQAGARAEKALVLVEVKWMSVGQEISSVLHLSVKLLKEHVDRYGPVGLLFPGHTGF